MSWESLPDRLCRRASGGPGQLFPGEWLAFFEKIPYNEMQDQIRKNGGERQPMRARRNDFSQGSIAKNILSLAIVKIVIVMI